MNTDVVNIKNTILTGNSASSGPDCAGSPFTSLGHNLIQDTSGCTLVGDLTGNVTGQDPLLGPLEDNGGPTFTHALLAGSPAIDSGDDSIAPATDQRGFARPQGVASDIGGFEFGADPPPPAPTPTPVPGLTEWVIVLMAGLFAGLLIVRLRVGQRRRSINK